MSERYSGQVAQLQPELVWLGKHAIPRRISFRTCGPFD